MAKVSLKKDFKNGDILYDVELNNNFSVIEAGINANEENLQEVIDQAIEELDEQLEEITADRGWDWNGGNRVTFYKGNTTQVTNREIVNGQLLYNTETGETALDDNNSRIVTGSGNVIEIGESTPTNPATKEWIKPSKMTSYAASYVVDSMTGSSTSQSPSVRAVKEYVSNEFDTFKDDVVLFSTGSATAYSHTLVLDDDALKFRELIIETSIHGTSTTNKAVVLPIVNNIILSGGTVDSYHWLDINVSSYTQNTKTLSLSTAYWSNSSNNSGVGIEKIIGRY